MPGNYSHTTRATGTVLTANIYNADHQNHIDNETPAGVDDDSASLADFQGTTDPGEPSSESLPNSLSGEIRRLRFAIKEMKTNLQSTITQWYTTLTGFSFAEGWNIAVGTTTGTKIGTATSQKLGFFNSTPVVQPANTTDLKDALSDLGLRASGGASPLDLDGGTLGSGSHTLTDGSNVVVGSTTGTKIATATTQKLGFYNATPVVQPSAYTQTYNTANKTHDNPTSAILTDSTGGSANTTVVDVTGAHDQTILNNNFADVVAQINALRVDLLDVKQLVNSVIDDLQTLGLVA